MSEPERLVDRASVDALVIAIGKVHGMAYGLTAGSTEEAVKSGKKQVAIWPRPPYTAAKLRQVIRLHCRYVLARLDNYEARNN